MARGQSLGEEFDPDVGPEEQSGQAVDITQLTNKVIVVYHRSAPGGRQHTYDLKELQSRGCDIDDIDVEYDEEWAFFSIIGTTDRLTPREDVVLAEFSAGGHDYHISYQYSEKINL